MTTKPLKTIGIVLTLWLVVSAPLLAGSHKDQGHHHKAHHGGCLNVIDTCELGHAEVRLENDLMTIWFTGGGNNTNKAVRVPDKEIVLFVSVGKAEKTRLVLKAKPIELAEESVGNCSRFEGRAVWLSSLTEFKADGKATVKGKARKIEIHYPEGYDPAHDHKNDH